MSFPIPKNKFEPSVQCLYVEKSGLGALGRGKKINIKATRKLIEDEVELEHG